MLTKQTNSLKKLLRIIHEPPLTLDITTARDCMNGILENRMPLCKRLIGLAVILNGVRERCTI
ncbi:unnamed protein product [Strongylus vulgaris]|uniref:Uncharacterized protein n=1 Tax=Strongylus vulgaris TaxID=40348 RepID=A0A3P7JC26_STRVU|nr:unnamed protein product [Strongylus vulgaris]